MENEIKKTELLTESAKAEFYEKTEKLRIIDDVFFRLIASRKDVCEEILRILLDEEKLIVVHVTVQEEIVSLFRKVRLDALCVLSDGRLCNIEMQKGDGNDDIRRVRFHASTITTNKTPEGTEFKDVPDVKVLYITEYDALKNNQLITKVKRCQKIGDQFVPIDDGEEIFFVNTVINDCTKKSKLLAHFMDRDCFSDPEFPAVSNAIRYYKETDEGRTEMKSVSEQWIEEGAELERKNTQREKERADAEKERADAAEELLGAERERADVAEENLKQAKEENRKLIEEIEKLKKK
ncbi:MAG: hypothetical protein IJH82_09625 [Lachnospiraceae bacterium]|nr:hypothetical protein [Lachnospiraceae bacterium]